MLRPLFRLTRPQIQRHVQPRVLVTAQARPVYRWYTAPTTQHCWHCGGQTKAANVLCDNADCNAIQPVRPDTSFFELLLEGKEPSYNVDTKTMRRKFLSLQQKAHPDSYSQASKQEHEYAQLQSSLLNKAYHTLKDPLARAKYMLELEGVEVSESESLHDPTLLMEVMELREELDEVTNEQELAQVKQTNDAKYQETVHQLADAFGKGDLDQAKELMVQLQYWETIRRAIIDWSP